tara:strand:+ start:118 stop:738 length:621 start_codon:yes stop_codon:yes gene_type:complete
MYKTCTKCENHKILTDFHKLNKGKYGRHSVCKICRSRLRKTNSFEVVIKEKICCKCNKKLDSKQFYKNKASKDGLQSYCKVCHKMKISESNSDLHNFCKKILKKYKNKHKNKIFEINYMDIVRKFKEQKGKCFITNHSMTHICDIKQRTDNVWNISINTNNDKVIKYENFQLVIHLIYTTKELYNLSIREAYNLYSEINLANNETQ